MDLPKHVELIEVCPRDGFQNVHDIIPFEGKVAIIKKLAEAGFKRLEIVSFVSPKAIPQLADAADVTRVVLEKYPGLDLFALIPNLRGAQNAYELGLRRVCYVVSLSKSHNKANINRTHEQSLEAYKEIRAAYPDLDIIVDLATTFGCPFEGKYDDPAAAVNFLKDYVDAGMKTCCLCDTIGIADPAQVRAVISAVKEAYPDLDLMVHFHDTRGLAHIERPALQEVDDEVALLVRIDSELDVHRRAVDVLQRFQQRAHHAGEGRFLQQPLAADEPDGVFEAVLAQRGLRFIVALHHQCAEPGGQAGRDIVHSDAAELTPLAVDDVHVVL